MTRLDPYDVLAQLWGVERQEAKYRAYAAAWGLPGSEQDLRDMHAMDDVLKRRMEATSGLEPE